MLVAGQGIPEIKNSKTGVIIRHKEYLADIPASILFNLNSFPLNPGMSKTFPWLSQIATAFEEYEFRGLIFEFKSMSSDAVLSASTSSSLGTVIMATQYDTADPDFADKVQMENHEFSNSSKPSLSFLHPIECARGQTPVTRLYTRNESISNAEDLKLYDLGKFEIATQGMQAASGAAGELWCSYEIKFFKPQLYQYLGSAQLADHWQGQNPTKTTGNILTDGTIVPVLHVGSNLGTTITSSPNSVLFAFPSYLQSGTYRFCLTMFGTAMGATDTVPTFSFTLTNCVNVLAFRNDVASAIQAPNATVAVAAATLTSLSYVRYIKITGSNATVAFNNTAGANDAFPGAALVDLYITQENPVML